ncbi:MAG TPA: hypothetical protein EYO33_17005 [Phycisphaerales bacterium]|nr:hypothetical protein [Phycisphaerales bacterium]
MHRTQARGIALTFVLLVIALLMVIVSTVAVQGLGSLRQAKVEEHSKQALFAAESGAADAIRNLVEDPTYPGPLPTTTMSGGAEYSAVVFNNFAGTAPTTASNNADVPAGTTYVLATGEFAGLTRRVGVLVSPGSATAFGLALGSGGEVRMGGSKTVRGSIKANQDIRLQGSSTIIPLRGSGRLLSSQDVRTQGSTRVDDAQDVRARGTVNSTPAIRGGLTIQSGDTTESTLPFIIDYTRTTNQLLAGEQGLVLPNPDQTVLFSAPNVVVHSTPPALPLDLNNQIHVFSVNQDFGSGDITGTGTIVVADGASLKFQGSQNLNANLIALRNSSQFPNSGNPTISFQGSTTVNGLIYAHEGIDVQGSFSLNGAMVAFRDGGAGIRTQGSTNITLDSSVFANVPGFESWALGFGGVGGIPAGAGPLSVVVWEAF